MSGQTTSTLALARSLRGRRYCVAAVVAPVARVQELAAVVATELDALRIDLSAEKLVPLAEGDPSRGLGVFGPAELADWLGRRAREPGVDYVVVARLEPLLATFGRRHVARFFDIAGRLEPRRPILLFTYLREQVEEAESMKDRTIIV